MSYASELINSERQNISLLLQVALSGIISTMQNNRSSARAMRLTFLGTGTSMGIPMIGCSCAVCSSSDPSNQRLRTSALLEYEGLSILFDAGPDLRQQALRVGLKRLDAVLLTHAHADHISGIDDLRPLNFAQHSSIPVSYTHLDVYKRQIYDR